MILFHLLHKTGGLTVCDHLRELYPNHFQIDPVNPNRSIREFASLPESDRFGFDCVCGHNAIALRNWVNPKLIPVTVLRDPIERVKSLYQFHRMHRSEKWHLLCKSYNLAWCCRNLSEFQNYYERKFLPHAGKFRMIFTSPESLLRTFGYQGVVRRINASTAAEYSQEDEIIAAGANGADLAIWQNIQSRAKLGRVVGPIAVTPAP